VRPMTKFVKLLTPGIGIKRWLALLSLGVVSVALGGALALVKLFGAGLVSEIAISSSWLTVLAMMVLGCLLIMLAIVQLSRSVTAPYARRQPGSVLDVMMQHSRRNKGFQFVAIGGGTGLPSILRGIKHYTSNITAIVTVADDGGSSGRLRRDLGVLPPGDLRNNIAALADDEALMTRLFQYRFDTGDLRGHSFGNLFIAALTSIVQESNGQHNSLAEALVEVERVLNIQGRVLPATLNDVRLVTSVKLSGSARRIKVRGEAQIEEVDGAIESLQLEPEDVEAYGPSVEAILKADVIVIGPGSLYTSILPNLMVPAIGDALRRTRAFKIYICNVATQPVETEGYDVGDHVLALERHIGRGVFQVVLANSFMPVKNAGENTKYVMPCHDNHEIHRRYQVRYTDLADEQRPWRHDPQKLALAVLELVNTRANL